MTILKYLERIAQGYKAKNFSGVAVQGGDLAKNSPHLVRSGGFSKWKRGRPIKYFPVHTTLWVGEDWLKDHLPVTFLHCVLCGTSFDCRTEIIFADLYQSRPSFGWPDEAVSMDEEGDRLYA